MSMSLVYFIFGWSSWTEWGVTVLPPTFALLAIAAAIWRHGKK